MGPCTRSRALLTTHYWTWACSTATRTLACRATCARARARASSPKSTTRAQWATTSTPHPLGARRPNPTTVLTRPAARRWWEAARSTAPTSTVARGTATMRPAASPSGTRRSPCTWWLTAATTTRAAALTTATPRSTRSTTVRGRWKRSTGETAAAGATARSRVHGSWPTSRTASGRAASKLGTRPLFTLTMSPRWSRAPPASSPSRVEMRSRATCRRCTRARGQTDTTRCRSRVPSSLVSGVTTRTGPSVHGSREQ
mmetsp:Transcript_72843/g.207521  ORF Transcript_72843/g.207521 Transcript_72843/m.207521 type:complete len:257 (-) Transcript_72843:1932-2702(-)